VGLVTIHKMHLLVPSRVAAPTEAPPPAVQRMVVFAGAPILAPPVSQKVNAVRLVRPLGQHVPRYGWSRQRGVVEFASLSELARPVLEVVLADRLPFSQGKGGLSRVILPSAPTLYIQGVMVLTRLPVFTSSCAQEVSAFRLPHSLGVR